MNKSSFICFTVAISYYTSCHDCFFAR